MRNLADRIPAAAEKKFAITDLVKTSTGAEEHILATELDFRTAHRTAVKYGFGVMYKSLDDGMYYRLSATERSALRAEVFPDQVVVPLTVSYE